eukprot:TRINITY_DN10092_c0_g1_i1.p1 TRINITY_DN10092_c0_g1~~TRINITY_DN10092_c0_g1_i1.p1  ORF type:complete len:223 (-),score=83.08 TRINITY_DN10092_c0_g1_i1:105-773(-)
MHSMHRTNRPFQLLVLCSVCTCFPNPHTPWLTPDGRLTTCHTEYHVVWEDKEVEELVEMCDDENVEKCVVETRRKCLTNCAKVRRKECRTVNTKQCRRRHVQGRGKRKCEKRRFCDYEWEVEGEAEVMVEVPGSCRESTRDNCDKGGGGREVCEDTPVNICEEVVEEDCGEFIEQDCSEQPVLVCKEEKKVGCRQVIKRVKKKVSRRAERKVCREGKASETV